MDSRWRKINTWSVKGPLLLIAAAWGLLDHRFGWGRTAFAASLAMAIPILGFRGLWGEIKFWMTLLILGLGQIALVVVIRPLLEPGKFPAMLSFGIIDAAIMVSLVGWAFSGDRVDREKRDG